MPRKGMRSLLFSSKKSSSPSLFPDSPSRPSFSDSVLERTLEIAEPIIKKWDADTSTFASVTSLFYENRREAKDFIKWVNNVHKSMHMYVSENSSYSDNKLVRAQKLMQVAMKRLQKEFYQILSMNRAHLDPESISARSSLTSRPSTRSSLSDYDDKDEEDEIRIANDSIYEVENVSRSGMTDLKLIAECMISSGYGKECVDIYKPMRKSIIDEAIYRLGVDKTIFNQINKMDWEVLEIKIKNWLNAMKVSMEMLFNGERILCDHVFATSAPIRESCFTDISKESALILFGFPELVARSNKKSPEKVFRTLDMYTAIASYRPEIESIFSFESTSVVRSQALAALIKLGDSVRIELTEFESSIQKDKLQSLIPGAGVHQLTIDVMSCLSLLADYSNVLADILADSPPPDKSALPESYFDISDFEASPAPSISLRFAWLILVLLRKLDVNAQHYKDVSHSYLLLANNLQYVIVKVHKSNLKYLLGDDWISKHEAKVKQFAAKYERIGWGHVIKSVSRDQTAEISQDEVKEYFKKFGTLFEHAYRKQSECVVPDSKLRDEIKKSIACKILPAYREFYNTHSLTIGRERSFSCVVRFAPDNVGHQLSDLFFGTREPGSSASSSSPSRASRRSSWWRRRW